MIKSVTVINPQGRVLKMELDRPDKTGLNITNITGIGPPKATINLSDISTGDGSFFNSAHVSSRNIVFSIKFYGNDIEASRQLAYIQFPIKKNVTLIFETDKRILVTNGYVESDEPDIFSSESGTQISIVCNDPYLYSQDMTVTPFRLVDPAFTFPFSNGSLTTPQLSLGIITLRTRTTFVYSGEVDTGVTVSMTVLGPVTNPVITNETSGISMRIDTTKLTSIVGSALTVGDTIVIVTNRGAKSVSLVRNGNVLNIMPSLGKYSSWFSLVNGDNMFVYSADSGIGNLVVSLSAKNVYEGV